MALVEKYIDETWFTWFGKYSDDDPYYYRVQSPVALCEVRPFCRRYEYWLIAVHSSTSMPAVRYLSPLPR